MPKKNKKFEPGIYNYCDRWCEKCRKTEKCFLFDKEQNDKAELISKGLDPADPKNLLLIVEKNFKETEDMLNKLIKKFKIDLSKIDDNKDEYEKVEKATKNHKLYKLSNKFVKKLDSYFKNTPSLDIFEYKEAFEKLNHHGFFMCPKIYRAVSGICQSKYEKGKDRAFSLEDSEKCAMIAYRSAMISKDSLELMDNYVVDFRLAEMIELTENIINELDLILKNLCHKSAPAKK